MKYKLSILIVLLIFIYRNETLLQMGRELSIHQCDYVHTKPIFYIARDRIFITIFIMDHHKFKWMVNQTVG